jgi:dUTP pyrophosphatase
MKKLVIKIKKEPGCEDLLLPQYKSPGAAGMDLFAAVENPVTIHPGNVMMIPTGIRLSIPPGYEGQVRPRSGLALNHHIGLLNSPGTIDSDYRGLVGVIMFNFGETPFVIKRGDRIAQLVICKVEKVSFQTVGELDSSKRDSGGFGSTGI